jgi:hypothetical protein
MPVLPGTIAQVIYRYTANNQICMATFGYVYTTGATTADQITATSSLLAIVSNVATNQLLDKMAAAQSTTISYLDVSVQVIWPTRYLKFKADIAKVGQVAGNCDAQNLAAVITKQTEFAGRDAVGSLHLGGLPPNAFQNGLLTAAGKTRMNFIATNLLLDINDASNGIVWHPCLVNKTPIVGTDPVKYQVSGSTLLYTTVVQPQLRVMRRRTVDLGI